MQFSVIDVHYFDDRDYAFGEQMEHRTGETEKCPECGAHISLRKWLPPLKAKLSKPSYGDFVFGTIFPFLVSRRFKDAYEASGMRGIASFEPVEIVKVNRKRASSHEPPDYYLPKVIRGPAVDMEKSDIQYDGKIECGYCKSIHGVKTAMGGFCIDESTWHGEDIFNPLGLSSAIVVTKKFIDFTEENGFTNIKFTPAEKFVLRFLRKGRLGRGEAP